LKNHNHIRLQDLHFFRSVPYKKTKSCMNEQNKTSNCIIFSSSSNTQAYKHQ